MNKTYTYLLRIRVAHFLPRVWTLLLLNWSGSSSRSQSSIGIWKLSPTFCWLQNVRLGKLEGLVIFSKAHLILECIVSFKVLRNLLSQCDHLCLLAPEVSNFDNWAQSDQGYVTMTFDWSSSTDPGITSMKDWMKVQRDTLGCGSSVSASVNRRSEFLFNNITDSSNPRVWIIF